MTFFLELRISLGYLPLHFLNGIEQRLNIERFAAEYKALCSRVVEPHDVDVLDRLSNDRRAWSDHVVDKVSVWARLGPIVDAFVIVLEVIA